MYVGWGLGRGGGRVCIGGAGGGAEGFGYLPGSANQFFFQT